MREGRWRLFQGPWGHPRRLLLPAGPLAPSQGLISQFKEKYPAPAFLCPQPPGLATMLLDTLGPWFSFFPHRKESS